MVVAFFRLLLVSAVADLAKAYQIVVDSDGELVVDSDGELVDESNAQASASSPSNGTFLVGQAVLWNSEPEGRIKRTVVAVLPDGKYSLDDYKNKPARKAVPSNEITKRTKTGERYWMKITGQLEAFLQPLKKALDASKTDEAIEVEILKIGSVLEKKGLDPRFARWLKKKYREYMKPRFDIERASEAWTEYIELYRNYPVDRVHRVAKDLWETGEPLECFWIQENGGQVRAVVRGVNGHSDAVIQQRESPEHGFLSLMPGMVLIGTSYVMPDRVKFEGDSLKKIGATEILGKSLESATMDELLSIFDYRKAKETGTSEMCCFHLLQSGLRDEQSNIPFQKYSGDCRAGDRPPVKFREAPMECCGESTLRERLELSERCFAIMLAEIELAGYSAATNGRYDQLRPLQGVIYDTPVKGASEGESCRQWLLSSFAMAIASNVHEAEGMLKMHLLHEALVMYFLQFQNEEFGGQQESKNVKSISSSKDDHVYVIGDIHSSIASLLYIMKSIKEANPSGDDEGLPGWLICRKGIFYVFLGDYVDRGDGADIEVITLILAYRVLCPLQETHGVLVLRGNHEDIHVQAMYGFMLAWLDRYHRLDYRLLEDSYRTMPIAGILNKEVLLTHGGLPPDTQWIEKGSSDHLFEEFNDVGGFIRFLNGWDMDTVPRVSADTTFANQNPLCIMLWADPRDANKKEFEINPRGLGFSFGPQASNKLFKQAGIRYTIRGHEYSNDFNVRGLPTERHLSGHFSQHRTLTVFSAAEYHRPHHKYLTKEIMERLGRTYNEGERAFGWEYFSSNGAYVEIKNGEHLKPIIYEFHEEVVYEKRKGRRPDEWEVYAKSVCKPAFTIEQELGNPEVPAKHESLTPLVNSLVSDEVPSTKLDDASGFDVESLIPVGCRGLDQARLIRNARRELQNMTAICLSNLSSVEAYIIREEDEVGEAVLGDEYEDFWNCVKMILRKALGQDQKVGQLYAETYGEDKRAWAAGVMRRQENKAAPVSPAGRSTKDRPGREEADRLAADSLATTIGGGVMGTLKFSGDQMDYLKKLKEASPEELAKLNAEMVSMLKNGGKSVIPGTSSAESLADGKSPKSVVSPGVRSSALPKGSGTEGRPDITRRLKKEEWAKLPTFSAAGDAPDDWDRVHAEMDRTLADMRAKLKPREGGDSSTVGISSVLQESYFSEPSMKVEGDEVPIKNHVMNGADWIQDAD